MHLNRLVTFALLALACLVPALPAGAGESPVLGGPRGGGFRAECPSGQYLTGLEVRTGAYIHAVAPVCASLSGDRFAEGVALPSHGGSGGEVRRYACDQDSYVSALGVSLTTGRTVNAIRFTCRSVKRASVTQSQCIDTGEGCRGRVTACKPSEAANGILGRSGKALDAIGLLCAPRPEPGAPPVTPAPTAEAPPADALQPESVPPGDAAPPAEPLARSAEAPDADEGAAADSAETEPPPPAAAAPKPEAVTAPPKPAAKLAPPPAPAADERFSVVPVFFGTDRAPLAGAPRVSFGAERARKLAIGRALVSVPTEHEVPNVERPWEIFIPGTSIKIYAEKEDPAKHFTMREIKTLTRDEFLKLVKERLKDSKGFPGQALIFVHGYNVGFDNAVYRTAQIAHDLKFDGAPFLYSWPSRGELAGYTYDAASNEQAEPYLREFVDLVIKKSGAKSVSVIAHSMGNRVVLRVLKELKAASPKVAINQIILAAPDVDRDTFETIAKELKGLSKGITLYAASNDKALGISKTVNGAVRAGDIPPSGPIVIEGMETIDVTALSDETFGLNHSTYAERNALLNDIAILLRTGERSPGKRIPSLLRIPLGKAAFWRFPAQQ